MSAGPVLTGNLTEDWKNLCDLWNRSSQVLMAEVGPLWEMPAQHQACILFADKYPNCKQFLTEKLSDPSPIIAAYAFKCLIRVGDLKPTDIPDSVLRREDTIETVAHSFVDETTLGEFISNYFDAYSSREELLEEQQRSLDWQQNELAEYYEAKGREKLGDVPDEPINVTTEMIQGLSAMKAEPKFHAKDLYPGAPSEDVRAKAERAVNNMLERLVDGLRASPRTSYVLFEFLQMLKEFEGEDTELRKQARVYCERVMELLQIEGSDGLNRWLYEIGGHK